MFTGNNQVLEYELVDGGRFLLSTKLASTIYDYVIRGNTLIVTATNGDVAQFVKAN